MGRKGKRRGAGMICFSSALFCRCKSDYVNTPHAFEAFPFSAKSFVSTGTLAWPRNDSNMLPGVHKSTNMMCSWYRVCVTRTRMSRIPWGSWRFARSRSRPMKTCGLGRVKFFACVSCASWFLQEPGRWKLWAVIRPPCGALHLVSGRSPKEAWCLATG